MTTEQQVSLALLQSIADGINSGYDIPNSMDDIKVARHRVAIKIPSPAQAQNAFSIAKNYLEAYMEVAALDEPGEIVYQEFTVDAHVDPSDNTWDGYCLIKLQRFIK